MAPPPETMHTLKTILVVDDDPIFRGHMTLLLTELGYRVIESSSGVGVTELVAREKPVACLIDLIMAEREGVETILELRSLPDCPKLIATSSNPIYLSMVEYMGVDATLCKPVGQERLQAALKQLFQT